MSTGKILVADDQEPLLLLIAATLGPSEDWELLTARNGEEALRLCREEKPDLVFLDVHMPEKNGFQVCRELKEDPTTKHVRVIMLTAMAQEHDVRQGAAAGADDYLTKPFSPTKLLDKVMETYSLA